ncbi:MAG TPA: aminodeoxychorismate synthase component I [Acidobacteriota bacterium]|nr:aminodeoxychorismate synthase component I [Acidobacteriota bacterium]
MAKGLVVLHDAAGRQWLRFEAPSRIISVCAMQDVLPALKEVESLVREEGLHAAGFLSYEAGSAFDAALKTHSVENFPLLWFGLYTKAEVIDLPAPDYGAYELGATEASLNRAGYDNAIRRVKKYIEAGDTYQVNYTLRMHAAFRGDPWHLFLAMVRAQSPGFAAYVDTGRHAICSSSPELFFRLEGNLLTCKPMKGTVHRGRTLDEDKTLSEWLQNSEKNRAENLMIVDMIRNDLGRVADVGSVRVPRMFEVERHPTLWQMTSTVTARCSGSLSDIMAALFPCASITGAPKVRTSEIIAELEPGPRRIYTGCIGFLSPGRTAQFSVAIRTALADPVSGQVEYGAGGGIVWDSESRDEYTEALLKARVLTERRPEFALLETLRWTMEESYFLLEYHLRRLADSAEYFGYPLDAELIQQRLLKESAAFGPAPRRVRLLVAQDGAIEIQSDPLNEKEAGKFLRVALAAEPVQSADIFLYHKTTHRLLYENARRGHPECDDVLLWNEKDELTESCVANVVLAIDGDLCTPPVDCGLLPGTFRAWLLEQGKIEERRLKVTDLQRCSKIWLINSVRKWQEAILDRQFQIPDSR